MSECKYVFIVYRYVDEVEVISCIYDTKEGAEKAMVALRKEIPGDYILTQFLLNQGN